VYRASLQTLLLLGVLAGCQQTTVPEEPVNHPPELNLVALRDIGPAPLTVEFRAQATDPDGDKLKYVWEIDFELLEGQAERTVIFDEPGTYSVSVLVTDGKWDVRDEVEIIVLDEDEPEL
jgi:PKD repeat protein